ncbi:asparaginase [Thermothelomyces thermophilus ATCC 42464]|uniref:Asparaginase n=1 Tax=Thermothelomyces thermophilus (strain ATCC 42464 / BCRC 31852 / DSM 1799) TaxID=573729 RepID=G2QJE0_THET4|nr:asparaginase [Thermothelomyces thermophilus ATCC 42464]AEO59697.1 asparaginase [Thermothelomyces thermophilus ATCC 42464]
MAASGSYLLSLTTLAHAFTHTQLHKPLLSLLALHGTVRGILAHPNPNPNLPFVINTWSGPFTAATDAAYYTLTNATGTGSPIAALDAVVAGCSACEQNQCDGTVGFGGSPDEACETTLDALIMDGTTLNSGAVAGLRRIRDAIAVARAVLERTRHSLLAGDLATRFAVEMGFGPEGDLSTPESRALCEDWRRGGCKGNYRVNVEPDPETSCGPYRPVPLLAGRGIRLEDGQASHDTISMVVIDRNGTMAAGTSTNGARFKVPGRVGDGPIVGSGSYVDGDVGGCGATGDGDIMMRFLPCYQAVENLRLGMTPTEAAEDAVRRMLRKYPTISSGVVVVNNKGEHGAAGSGWTFTYSFRGGKMDAAEVVSVPPLAGLPVGRIRMESDNALREL